MKTTSEVCGFARATWRTAAVGLALLAGLNAPGKDIQLPVLKTKTGCLTNVTVTGTSPKDIYVTHSRGMTNIKIKDLDAESLGLLGLHVSHTADPESAPATASAKADEVKPKSAATTASFTMPDFASQLNGKLPASLAMLQNLPSIRLSTGMVLGAIGLILVAYVFMCYCLKMICEKTGQKPGAMIWFPILQMFPLLRAAGMSGWWLLGFALPFINIVASILWSFRIVKACGKSVWVAIGLLLPITNLFALLYLAFSSGGGASDEEEIIRSETPLPPLLAEA